MDDKKKLMVLGAMGVVLLGIGAFQFVKASGSQQPAAAPKPAATTSTASADANGDKSGDILAPQQNDLVKGAYAYRDPFKPLVDSNARPASNPTPTPAPHPGQRHDGIPNFPGIDTHGGLPPVAGATGGGQVVPVKPAAPAFPYTLAGVIMGKKPAAVFVDSDKVQHLVELGGSLDGDIQLVDLDREHVVLRVKGEIKNLNLGGGDSSAK